MAELGLAAALFWTAFLAATVLPFSSEAALSGALLAGLSPWTAFFSAAFGNILGSASTYLLGRLGKLEWLEKYVRVKREQIQKTRDRIRFSGGAAAFFCFLPICGDLFAIALGFLRYPAGKFVLYMSAGKLFRYALWMAIHLQAEKITGG